MDDEVAEKSDFWSNTSKNKLTNAASCQEVKEARIQEVSAKKCFRKISFVEILRTFWHKALKVLKSQTYQETFSKYFSIIALKSHSLMVITRNKTKI